MTEIIKKKCTLMEIKPRKPFFLMEKKVPLVLGAYILSLPQFTSEFACGRFLCKIMCLWLNDQYQKSVRAK